MQCDVPYQPVNCEFHDVLESIATVGKPVSIAVRTLGGRRECFAAIVDIYSKEGAEYIALSSGEIIRLDRLIAVDSVSARHFDPLLPSSNAAR